MANRNDNRSKPEDKRDNSSTYRKNGKSSNYKGKNRSRKPCEAKDSTKNVVRDAINDVSWYAHNPQMLQDSASLAFNQMLGLPLQFGSFGTGTVGTIQDKLPGLLTLRMVPSFGAVASDATGANSALNIAAENVYSYVRHANSGHSNYDAPDLMTYIIAMDQAYSFHAELVRAYGLMRFYSGFNRYLGKYIVEALGFNYVDLLSNLAAFRYQINAFGAKLSTFAVPAIFPLFERHRWIYSNVYMDRPSTRAQLYAFVPEYLGVYNEPVSAGGEEYKAGVRARVNPDGYKKTLSDIITRIDEVVSPLLHSEDIGIMSGDILKAYGADKCYQINALSEEYVLGPVYIEEVLKQIHNSVTIGAPFFHIQNGNSMLAWQDGLAPIIHTWNRSHTAAFWVYNEGMTFPSPAIYDNEFINGPKLLDTNGDSPTAGDVMVMSRLMNIPSEHGKGSIETFRINGDDTDPKNMNVLFQEGTYTAIGADAVMFYCVFSGELDSVGNPEFTRMFSTNFVVDDGSSVHNNTVLYRNGLADISKFNWHPIMYEVGLRAADIGIDVEEIDAKNISLRIIADLDNCVVVQPGTIGRMHDVALLSMLNVPSAVLSKGI